MKLLAVMLFSLGLSAAASPTQDIQTKGAISGIIVDINGAVVFQLGKFSYAPFIFNTYKIAQSKSRFMQRHRAYNA